MGTITDVLLLVVAFAGLAVFPLLVPWAAVRVTVSLLEARPARPADRRPAPSRRPPHGHRDTGAVREGVRTAPEGEVLSPDSVRYRQQQEQ